MLDQGTQESGYRKWTATVLVDGWKQEWGDVGLSSSENLRSRGRSGGGVRWSWVRVWQRTEEKQWSASAGIGHELGSWTTDLEVWAE